MRGRRKEVGRESESQMERGKRKRKSKPATAANPWVTLVKKCWLTQKTC